ncbi:LEA type 2 family protein [Halogeometricum luteum]|uniref:LEA type 2 family protein n=1 Tax=Halogeometricum luteum TaxID=2950537 RepID=A0ABU2FX49_9EURY|nr:LEA type 2 family protein [Halogeometricum sp. S3BR5-2]MDS0293118.1 LEA type 2 family protein [Halogeometricum sp. S3BR5-2]
MFGQIAPLFLGSRVRVVGTALAALLVLCGGAVAAGVVGAPAVSDVENRFGTVTEEATVVETTIGVSNPNPVGVELGGVTVGYDVWMNDVRMASGEKSGVAVGAGNATVNATTEMRNERIAPWWRSHVSNGERTVVSVDPTVRSATLGRTFDAPNVTREVETDMLSQFDSAKTRPVNANAPLVSDPILYVEETRAAWGAVNESTTALELAFVVRNPKPYPITVSRLGYDISMNDVTLGEGASDSAHVIPPESTRTVRTTTYLRNENFDEWWVSHLERNQVSDLRMTFHARLDAAGETFRVPLDALTYEQRVETDLFGTKPTAGAGNATAGGDPAGSEEGATRTEAETETGTETGPGTATPGDGDGSDGGLLGGETSTGGTATDAAAGDDGLFAVDPIE